MVWSGGRYGWRVALKIKTFNAKIKMLLLLFREKGKQ
jgi:hypothetical protein